MAHVAFLSYSKNDKETVNAICNALEKNGIGCWYAPRDVPIGADWEASIVEALSSSRVMILVWSSHSDQSRQVKREVALALDDINVKVIPFRIESIKPSKLRYYLSDIQWFDASSTPAEDDLERLVAQVKIAIPTDGQVLVREKEKRQRLEEEQTNQGEETLLLSRVNALQEAEAETLEEAEAAAFRQSRLLAEVESLRHAGARILPPVEAEVLRRAAEAEAVRYAGAKALLLAKAESLHQAVEATLERARKWNGKRNCPRSPSNRIVKESGVLA